MASLAPGLGRPEEFGEEVEERRSGAEEVGEVAEEREEGEVGRGSLPRGRVLLR